MKSHDFIIDQLAQIHKIYLQSVNKNVENHKNISILKVRAEKESNMFEHNAISKDLFVTHGIKVIDFTLSEETLGLLSLDPNTGKLHFNGLEVSVVYLRSGYNEQDYPEKDCLMFRFRELAEKSLAISIPTLKIQLLGMKIIQKFLTSDEFIQKIGLDQNQLKNTRKCTTKILNIKADFDSSKAKLLKAIENDLDK